MPIRNDTDELIEFLNSLVKIDPGAMSCLFSIRTPCLPELAEHDTVQVLDNVDDHPPLVGVLGILNGFCGVFDNGPREGWGPITAEFEGEQLVRFVRTENK